MDKRLGFVACLVIGLASIFTLELMADGTQPAKGKPVANPSQMQIQMAVQMQQYQQGQSQLLKKYEERQNIQAALETIEKNRARQKDPSLSKLYKETIKTEQKLMQRRQVLAAEIQDLENQLKK